MSEVISKTNKDKSYNHAFSLNFTVPGSKYEDWEDCIKFELDKIKRNLSRAANEDPSKESSELNTLEGWDTFEEDK